MSLFLDFTGSQAAAALSLVEVEKLKLKDWFNFLIMFPMSIIGKEQPKRQHIIQI